MDDVVQLWLSWGFDQALYVFSEKEIAVTTI